jgi:hypothetical protein
MKKTLLPLLMIAIALATLTSVAGANKARTLWNDGEPEVTLGIYFDEAGTDSILSGEVPDTLIAYVVMTNGSIRDEGSVWAVEYMVEIPDGLILLSEELPEYSNMAMGTALGGITEAVREKSGNGLLLNKLILLKRNEVPFDSRIKVVPHPVTKNLLYVYGTGTKDIHEGLMVGQDGIVNPKVSEASWKPVHSK